MRDTWGSRDRSWGIRPVGERNAYGAPTGPPQFFWLWAPLGWLGVLVILLLLIGRQRYVDSRESGGQLAGLRRENLALRADLQLTDGDVQGARDSLRLAHELALKRSDVARSEVAGLVQCGPCVFVRYTSTDTGAGCPASPRIVTRTWTDRKSVV